MNGAAAASQSSAFLPPGFARWRLRARQYLHTNVAPEQALWDEAQLSLHDRPTTTRDATTARPVPVPREFMRLAASAACHCDPGRWSLLYRILWRITRGERQLLEVTTDPDVHRALALDKAARRAAHKMKAFVRFRRVPGFGGTDVERFVAWFEPAHHVVERTAPFFARRFAGMRWSIFTPERCAHWDGERVTFAPGATPDSALRADAFEDLWREYYASVFNPARLAPGVMRAEMPKSYWKNLPEARVIAELTRSAPARVAEMIARAAAPAQPLPDEFRMAGDSTSPSAVPMRASRIRLGRVRPSGLDLPSWDAVYDPGPGAARARADALSPGSGRAVQLGDVRVMPGVAGWTDPSLLAPGIFYPDDAVTPEDRLRFYASRFAMVEVDSTYYALPRREHAVAWVRRTPADFVFNIKAHALMTGHGNDVRRLPDWLRRDARGIASNGVVYGSDLSDAQLDELWRRYLDTLQPLTEAGKLGAVFLQFPRWFEPGSRAERALRAIARRLGDTRGAIEFRSPAWGDSATAERTFALLRELRLAYTVVDAPQGTRSSMPPVVRVTRDDFAVVRLHGRRVDRWEARNEYVTERYRYLYTRDQVNEWVGQVEVMATLMRGGMLQVSYNNNHANYATTNAAEFGEELESRATS